MLLCNCIMSPATLSLSEVLVPAAPPRASRGRCFSQLSSEKSAVAPPPQRRWRTMSPLETRISLILALASQASSLSQRAFLGLATETAKCVFPRRFPSRNLEEAFMSVPDLETVKFKVLSQTDQYEIRDVDPYYIAFTMMPGNKGFDDFNGASRSFNVLAAYLFGKNATQDKIEMTTPVISQKTQSGGEKMEMTTPVITKRLEDQTKWQMSFVMPSKYGSNLPFPKDPSVKIREVPRKIVAVVAFSGFVTDEDIKHRESKLRDALKYDRQFQAKVGASLEVAQYNPPFTLPFMHRNEIALEVERKPE